ARSTLAFLGETPWIDELILGIPFAGAAGSMVSRIFRRNQWTREQYRFDNTIRCAPPTLEPARIPGFAGAVTHCRQYSDTTLTEGHQVIVPLGNTAIRRVFDLWGKGIKVEDFHGTVTRDPTDQFWIVPSYHPSHLQRGAVNLIGVVSFDLQRAHQVAAHGWDPDPMTLVVDPPLDWFEAWATQYLAAAAKDPDDVWLAVDIETPEKKGRDESTLGPLSPEMLADKVTYDRSYKIERVNFASHPDEGITVPYVEPYISIVKRVCASVGTKVLWFSDYDWPRLAAAECHLGGTVYDLPWAMHLLQSDLPLGLGFWSPFYSTYGAWKHLSDSDPGLYAAIDPAQTLRVGFGGVTDLMAQGLWETYLRHVHRLKTEVLTPAHVIGVQIDRKHLEAFEAELTEKAIGFQQSIQTIAPDHLRPLTPKGGLKSPPVAEAHARARTETVRGEKKKHQPSALTQDLFAHAEVVSREEAREVLVCTTCDAKDIQKRHRCPDTKGENPAALSIQKVPVRRYYWKEPFNPSSWQQLLTYIKHRKHQPGKAKRTGKDSTDRETLQRLMRTGDPLYGETIKLRAVTKVLGTYVIGTRRRLDKHNRIHPVPTFRPSTQRLSYENPNITNVVADKDTGRKNLAGGFRKCIIAGPGCRLLEIDFAGVEAIEVGWLCHDPEYIRLAKLGVHAGLASFLLGRPYDRTWPREQIVAYFKEIKASHYDVYDQSKHFVHGDNYGLTEYGMVKNFPEVFPDLHAARAIKAIYHDLAPKIPEWQRAVRDYADTHGYLGGFGDPPFGHPFGYKHWFWSIYAYKRISNATRINIEARCRKQGILAPVTEINGIPYRISLGEDAKRAVAFGPQSIGAAVLKEKMLVLFDREEAIDDSYIGDAYYGQTPLRAPIHDSLLLEVPDAQWDRVCEIAFREMQRPIWQQPVPPEWNMGTHLAIGIGATAGHDWENMEAIEIPGTDVIATDRVFFPAEEDDDEEVQDLGVVA
ncbi:hypothetical protein LCGC14_1505670, partial [marine sediment metagenome]